MSEEDSEDGESVIYLGTPKKVIECVNLQGDETRRPVKVIVGRVRMIQE